MRLLSGKIFFILIFSVFWGIIAITGHWYPDMNLPLTNDPMQNGVLRVLASFTYTNDESFQQILIIALLIELSISAASWGWLNYQEYKNMIKYLGFTIGLLWFFYWRFISRYAEELFLFSKADMFQNFIIQFGIIIGMGVITTLIGKKFQLKQEITQAKLQKIPHLEFECPMCHSKYQSNVQYCTQCQQEIESIPLKDN
jgi:hypothetical protein